MSYLYNCVGCGKPDKEFPNEEKFCEHTGEWYVPTCRPLEHHKWARNDAYNIYTGLFCDKCYNDPHKYTYRRDRYHDEAYCGERLEPDDF